MRKLLVFLMAMMLVFSFAGFALAVGSSMTVSDDNVFWSDGEALNRISIRVITIIFTADSVTGTIPDLTLNAATAGIKHRDLKGWRAYKMVIDGNHGGTEPQENSEVYIYQSGIDLLNGNGVDQVDNTAKRQIYFETDSLPMPQPIFDDLTVTVTQQAVATVSATGTIYLVLVP